MARGGKRTPANPAPVSGPGALSARTDGGAGSASQPLRTPTGLGYGEAKALTEAQRAAPLAARGEGGAGDVVPLAPPPPQGGVFGATQRPTEPPTTGMTSPQMAAAADVDQFLRILYSKFPHPGIAALLRNG